MNFSYLQEGDPSKPLLIFLHGFMGDKEDWLPLIDQLKAQYYCLSLDLPGHGQTPLEEFTSFDQMVNQLHFFLQKILNGKKANLIGYSLGGRVALQLAIEYGGYFEKVVLESCNPGIQNKTERKERYIQDLKLLKDIKTDKDKNDFLKKWFNLELFGKLSSHPDFQKLLKKRLKGNFESWSQSLNFLSVGAQQNLWPKVNNIQKPVLYINGTDDKKYQAIGENLAKANPQIRQLNLEKCSHNTHFENKALFDQILRSFLES